MKTAPIEELRASFWYDPETGDITRRSGNGEKATVSVGSKGYLAVWHKGRSILAHRIAFAMHFGRWPDGQIDHINRVKTDNRIANLREASHAENCRNVGNRADNSSGIRGVHLHKQTGKWMAKIRAGGNQLFLGAFENIIHAAMVRRIAEACIWGGIHKFEEEKHETL